jgi:hypothetical protein
MNRDPYKRENIGYRIYFQGWKRNIRILGMRNRPFIKLHGPFTKPSHITHWKVTKLNYCTAKPKLYIST